MSLFIVKRLDQDADSTIGQLFEDGHILPLGFVLEPGANTPLHPRIPAGTYDLVLRETGGKAEEYRAMFGGQWFRGIPEIRVPGRNFIEVHIGNSIADTQGCALVGLQRLPPKFAASEHWEVEHSRAAFEKIYPYLRDACLQGRTQWQVKNSDERASAKSVQSGEAA